MSDKEQLRRIIQAFSLLLFLSLLFAVAMGVTSKALSIFLMLDPLSALVTSISTRSFVIWIAVPIAVALLTALFGRIFCGYICPMGTTVDIFDKLSGTKTNKSYKNINGVRFIILFAVISASIFGVNLVFHMLPISLATRLYGLVIYPSLTVVSSELVITGQKLFDIFGFFAVDSKRYASILFIIAFFTALFFVSRKSKRFWCRYICPTGAFLGLLSTFAPYKRRVSNACIECGKCEHYCPTDAIKGIYNYNPQECITCKKCESICQPNAVSFNVNATTTSPSIHHTLITRRKVVIGLAVGGSGALVSMTELKSLLYSTTEHGDLVFDGLIRPPGALPEGEFLSKCIRCGQCMVACPTNGLQPLLADSGTAAAFSPVLVPLRGKCEVSCNICGIACPTGAISHLPIEEKQHAKIGTARIKKERCLAWQENKECIVCGEVCPYNAMQLVPESGYTVTVPKVMDNRCFGCGACEYSCPVEIPAVEIEPTKALRLRSTNYTERSKELGLDLTVSSEQKVFEQTEKDDGGLPPGFVE